MIYCPGSTFNSILKLETVNHFSLKIIAFDLLLFSAIKRYMANNHHWPEILWGIGRKKCDDFKGMRKMMGHFSLLQRERSVQLMESVQKLMIVLNNEWAPRGAEGRPVQPIDIAPHGLIANV